MFYSISFFSMLANATQILSTPVCLRKLTKVSLGEERGKEETGLLKDYEEGCQETKSTCCRYTTDFQEKCNSCTTVASKQSSCGTSRAKDLEHVAYKISFSGFYPDLFLSSHAQPKMCSTSFLSKYTGIFLI